MNELHTDKIRETRMNIQIDNIVEWQSVRDAPNTECDAGGTYRTRFARSKRFGGLIKSFRKQVVTCVRRGDKLEECKQQLSFKLYTLLSINY